MTIVIDKALRLESVDDCHAEDIFRLAEANRRHLEEWLPWVKNMQSVDFIRNFIKGSKQRGAEGLELAFVILENENVIGRIGVYKINNHDRIGEIGYWIAGDSEGKGFVTRACAGLLKFCFMDLDLNRVEIKCGAGNLRSRHVPERLGFVNEGIIRQGELVNGRFIDLHLFSMLKQDWLKN